MYDIVTYGFISVKNSITNPETTQKTQLDKSQPFTYYDFLKNTRGTNTAVEYNDGYLKYLQSWYKLQGETPEATQQLIANQYINLLRDINLNYTTNEEKRFLQNIDFNSREDLEIVIPFYSRKLKDIILHVRDKREDVKYVVDVNSIKGSNKSLEKAVFETITQVILNDNPNNVSLTDVVTNMEIEVEEFIDTYSKYFNITPEPINEPELRKKFYSSNSNIIDGDLFINFDAKLRENIFRNVFLEEIGTNFTVNVDVTSLISCDPTDTFGAQLNKQCAGGISIEDRLNLQKLIIQKYIGTDYYYLSSNTVGDTLTGILFKAENPTGNFLNIRNSSTQTIPSEQLVSLRQLGLYFTPEKTGLLRFNTKNKQPYFNRELIEADTTYIFPDPEVYGNIFYGDESPVIYKVTYGGDITNITKTFAVGDPYVTRQDQPYYGYYSKQQDIHVENNNRFDIDLVSLYNEGYIKEWRQDVYGNQFGLFKSKFSEYFRTFQDDSDILIKELLLNGDTFFNNFNGYNITDRFTTFTGDFSSTPVDYYITNRQFVPYSEFRSSGSEIIYNFTDKDCGFFTFLNDSALPDIISSDSILLPNTQLGFYYNKLADGGLTTNFTRPLVGTLGEEATFLSSPNNILSSGDMYDGGGFTIEPHFKHLYDYSDNYPYIDIVNDKSLTVTGSNTHDIQSIKDNLSGRLFVGNYITGSVHPLSAKEGLYEIFRKYNTEVQNSVFSADIIDFNIFYNCIQITTSDYFVIDNISFDKDGFTTPFTVNTYHSLSGVQITNPVYIDGKVYYCILKLENLPDKQVVVPELYSYDITSNTEVQELPNFNTTFNTLSSHFIVNQDIETNILSKIVTPRLTHNTKNMLFGLTFLMYNQNNIPHVFDYKLEGIKKPFKLVSSNVYKPINTTTLHSTTTDDIIGSGVSIEGGSFKL